MFRNVLIPAAASLLLALGWVIPAQSEEFEATIFECSPPKVKPQLAPQGEILCVIGRNGPTRYIQGFATASTSRWYRLNDDGTEDYIEATVLDHIVVAAGVLGLGFWNRSAGEDPDPPNTRRWEIEHEGMRAIIAEIVGGG